jgi:hypothetical protein
MGLSNQLGDIMNCSFVREKFFVRDYKNSLLLSPRSRRRECYNYSTGKGCHSSTPFQHLYKETPCTKKPLLLSFSCAHKVHHTLPHVVYSFFLISTSIAILNNCVLPILMHIAVKNHDSIFMNRDELHG